MDRQTESTEMMLRRLREKLGAINPMEVLNRGYALVYDRNGRILARKTEAEAWNDMTVRFADGEIEVHRHG